MSTRTTAHARAPMVSIGLPVYNGEAYIALAIESLLAQTFTDFELIVSDNGSSDRTAEICRTYAESEPRVRCVCHAENRGAAWNFNHVFELSRGRYFKWAAHDDLHEPTYLAECVRVLDDHPDVIWCHSRTQLIDEHGEPLEGPEGGVVSYAGGNGDHPPGGNGTPTTRESVDAPSRFRAVILGLRGNRDIFGLMRSDAIARTALHLPHYGADKVFVAELGLLGRYREIPRSLYFGRVHPGGSGALRTAAEQQYFIDPFGRTRGATLRLQLLLEYTRAIHRAGLTAAEQARCFAIVVRYLFQVQKWWEVVRRTATGSGTGGGYLPALRALERRDRTGSNGSDRRCP